MFLVTYVGSTKRLRSFQIGNVALGLATPTVLIRESVNQTSKGVAVSTFSFMMGAQLTGMQSHARVAGRVAIGLITGCFAAWGTYMAWLWWHGLSVLPRTDCGDESAFFWTKASMWHWYCTCMKVLSTTHLVAFGLGKVISVLLQ